MTQQAQTSTTKREVVADAGTTNTHYLEIRRMIEAGIPLPVSFYSEKHVGPNGEQRPFRVNRASFSVYQPRS
jgi:hypothetical protein